MARHLSKVHFDTNDAIELPVGTTAQRPSSPVAGMFRYNSTDGQFEGYTTEWGAIAGGGGSVEVEKNIYTGDGSDVTFDTTSTISSENNIQVYLDGVYQSKDNYTTSGNTVTFSTAPPNNVSVELIHILSANATMIVDTLTGNGSTTAFTLTANVADENNTQVYVNGVYQSKNNYSTSGNTITFSTAPSNGDSVEVVNIKPINTNQLAAGTVYEEQLSVTNTPTDGYVLTYDSGTAGFTWEQKFDGDITGIVAGNGLTGDATSGDASLAVGAGTGITVNANDVQISDGGVGTTQLADDAVTIAKIADAAIVTESEGISSNDNDTTLPTSAAVKDYVDSQGIGVSVISSNTTAVSGNLYVLTANLTLTLPASPSAGNYIKVSNRSGVATCTIARNSEKIMGATADLTIDKLNAGFEMIYSGSAQGWVLIGVEGTAS